MIKIATGGSESGMAAVAARRYAMTMTTFDEAYARLAGAVVPLGSETAALPAAAGRVLAKGLAARADSPLWAVSVMDGYALTADDAVAGADSVATLAVVGEARPGQPFDGTVARGQAVRIFTGAPVPDGADLVVVQECADRDGGLVRLRPGFGPAVHIRAAGSDFRRGDVLLAAGTLLTPQAMIAAAAADVAEVVVARRPRLALLATGDELAAPGHAADVPGQIPDSASIGVAALAAAAGADVVSRARGPDDLAALTALADAALGNDGREMADVVVVTGGASVGDHDLARPAFGGHSLTFLIDKLAVKPGRPVWLARTARGQWIVGLPGNPGSALVMARLLLVPLLAALQGRAMADALVWRRLPLAAPTPPTGGRETLARARWGVDGLVPVANQDSGAQAALAAADWLIRLPPHAAPLAAGALVTALML